MGHDLCRCCLAETIKVTSLIPKCNHIMQTRALGGSFDYSAWLQSHKCFDACSNLDGDACCVTCCDSMLPVLQANARLAAAANEAEQLGKRLEDARAQIMQLVDQLDSYGAQVCDAAAPCLSQALAAA